MLQIYYARENVNQNAFIYDRVSTSLSRIRANFDAIMDARPVGAEDEAAPERIFLVVPEQYTLQAEREAMDEMNLEGFIDFDVQSFSSLARRTFADTGKHIDESKFINQNGKVMLVTKLLCDNAAKDKSKTSGDGKSCDADDLTGDCDNVTGLKVYGGVRQSIKVAANISDMISELKNFGCSPEDLAAISESLGDDNLLGRKLSDVSLIYRGFEAALSSRKLPDAADKRTLFEKCIPQSNLIAGAEIWIKGYDYFSPAMIAVTLALAKKAKRVNVMLTADLQDPFFSLTNELGTQLAAAAKEANIEAVMEEVGEPEVARPAEIAFIEKYLFSYGSRPTPPCLTDAIVLTQAAGFYSEAETIASKICDLVRDEGLRYRDILVLCNDMEVRVPILRRVFKDYGLPVFVDQRRNVDHNPVIELILSLPQLASDEMRYEDVFRFLKTGLSGIKSEEIDALENYVIEHKVRGKMWERDFEPDNPEEMQALNASREKVCELLGKFCKEFNEADTARTKTETLLEFLNERLGLPEKIAQLKSTLKDAGNLEYAAELGGIEKPAIEILKQLAEVLGDMEMDAEEYSRCLHSGFASMRIGVLPTTNDGIVIGTMQRTRSAEIEVLFVAGANDGVLPAAASDEGILSSDEKEWLESQGDFLGRSDDAIYFEEQLAIYRNLTKPKKALYISYSVSDAEGVDIKPSDIFNRIKRLLPDLVIHKDVISGGDDYPRIQHPEEVLPHLADELTESAAGGAGNPNLLWKSVETWFETHPDYRSRLSNIKKGLAYKGGHETIAPENLKCLLENTPLRHSGLSCPSGYVPESKHIGNNVFTLPASPSSIERSGTPPESLDDPAMPASPSSIERYSRCPFSWLMNNALRLRERRIRELDPRSVGDIYHEILMKYGEQMESKSKWNWDSISYDECRSLVVSIAEEIVSENKGGILSGSEAYNAYKARRISQVAEEVAWQVTESVRESEIKNMLFEVGFGTKGNNRFPPLNIETEAGTSDIPASLKIHGRIDRVDILEGGSAIISDYKSGNDKFQPDDVKNGWQMQLIIYLMAVSRKYKPGGVRYIGVSESHIKDVGQSEDAIKKEIAKDVIKKTVTDTEEFEGAVRSHLETLATNMSKGFVGAVPMASKVPLRGTKRTACTYCPYGGICALCQ